jgi:HEAT repeat protein
VAVALARAATDAEWDVRFAALNALRGSKSVAAREAMERAQRDEDARVRVLATRLLSEVVG